MSSGGFHRRKRRGVLGGRGDDADADDARAPMAEVDIIEAARGGWDVAMESSESLDSLESFAVRRGDGTGGIEG